LEVKMREVICLFSFFAIIGSPALSYVEDCSMSLLLHSSMHVSIGKQTIYGHAHWRLRVRMSMPINRLFITRASSARTLAMIRVHRHGCAAAQRVPGSVVRYQSYRDRWSHPHSHLARGKGQSVAAHT